MFSGGGEAAIVYVDLVCSCHVASVIIMKK